jgi:hypothetical protein
VKSFYLEYTNWQVKKGKGRAFEETRITMEEVVEKAKEYQKGGAIDVKISMFIMDQNIRDVDEGHVAKLVEAFSKEGVLLLLKNRLRRSYIRCWGCIKTHLKNA